MNPQTLKRLYNASVMTVVICLGILIFSEKIPGITRNEANFLYGFSIILFFIINGVYESKRGMITPQRFLLVLVMATIMSVAIFLGLTFGLQVYSADKFYLPFLLGLFFIIPFGKKKPQQDTKSTPKSVAPQHKKKKKKGK